MARHHQKLRQDRRCRTFTDGDGALRLEAVLAPATGAELVAALDTQVDRIFRAATRSGYYESPDAYRADALVALVTGRGILGPSRRNKTGADSGTAGTEPGGSDSTSSSDSDPATSQPDSVDATPGCRQPGPGTQVIIRTDLSALRRGHTRPGEVCEIEGVGPIPVDEAISAMGRALCHLVVTNGVDVTTICRLGRNIPTPLALALLERDRTCVVPGCDVTKGLEFDHWQVDYAQGGTISMDNLARLCKHHHRLKTHQGFRLMGGPGQWEFVAPDTPKRPKRKPSGDPTERAPPLPPPTPDRDCSPTGSEPHTPRPTRPMAGGHDGAGGRGRDEGAAMGWPSRGRCYSSEGHFGKQSVELPNAWNILPRSRSDFMTTTLTKNARALIQRPVIANVATVDADGRPQVTPVWIDLDGDDLLFNTAKGRTKVNNLEKNPHVAVSIVDPDNSYNVVVVRGTAEGTEEGADAHIDSLAKKYLDVDTYPMRQPGEVRVTYRVHADNVVMQPEDDA